MVPVILLLWTPRHQRMRQEDRALRLDVWFFMSSYLLKLCLLACSMLYLAHTTHYIPQEEDHSNESVMQCTSYVQRAVRANSLPMMQQFPNRKAPQTDYITEQATCTKPHWATMVSLQYFVQLNATSSFIRFIHTVLHILSSYNDNEAAAQLLQRRQPGCLDLRSSFDCLAV